MKKAIVPDLISHSSCPSLIPNKQQTAGPPEGTGRLPEGGRGGRRFQKYGEPLGRYRPFQGTLAVSSVLFV